MQNKLVIIFKLDFISSYFCSGNLKIQCKINFMDQEFVTSDEL